MKILIDQNLSGSIATLLGDRFPGSAHVKSLRLETADDLVIWRYCREAGYTFLTKDGDFEDAREHPGPPPKVILLRIGNASTSRVVALLLRNEARIVAFGADNRRILVLP